MRSPFTESSRRRGVALLAATERKQNMPRPPMRYKFLRMWTRPEAGGEILNFVTGGGARRRPATFFRPSEIPEFEDESACFEVGRDTKGRWMFRRRVDETGEPVG